MPARRKSPRRSKSRSKSPRRVRRSSGKARMSRRVTRRSSKRARLSRGAVYGAQEVEDVRAGRSDLAIRNRGVQPKGTASYRYRATSAQSFCILTNCHTTLSSQLYDELTNLATPKQIDFDTLYAGTVLIFASQELFDGDSLNIDTEYQLFTEMGFAENKVKRLQNMNIPQDEQWQEKCFSLLTSDGVILPVLPNMFKGIVDALMRVQNGKHRVHHVIILQNCDSTHGTYDEESIFWRSSAWSVNEPYNASEHNVILKPMIEEAITRMCEDACVRLSDIEKRAETRSIITRIMTIGEVTTRQNAKNVLGLSSDDSLATIKRAFHKLSLRIHPDKTNEPGAVEAFQKLGAARDFLLGP